MKKDIITDCLTALRPLENKLWSAEGLIVLLQSVVMTWEPPPELDPGRKLNIITTVEVVIDDLKNAYKKAWEDIGALRNK